MNTLIFRDRLLACLFMAHVFFTTGALAQTNVSPLSYKTVDQWNIGSAGFGKVVVLNKPNPTEQELRVLAEKLKQDTKNDKITFIFIYDDERAARNRRAATSETLTKAEMQHYYRHQVAQYLRNANSGVHKLVIYPKGLSGPMIEVGY